MNDATRTRASKGLLAGLFAVVAGVAVLAGWLFEIPSLKSVLPGVVAMKANTAVGFILAGLSLARRHHGSGDAHSRSQARGERTADPGRQAAPLHERGTGLR